MNTKTIFNKIVDRLVDDDFRRAFSLILLSALLSITSLIAFVAHITHDDRNDLLMAWILLATFVFATAIFFLALFARKQHAIYRYIFITGIVALFTYLSYDQGPHGFFYFWILLIPAFSFIMFGIFEGLICSIPMFIVMCVLFWTPLFDYLKYSGTEQAIDSNFKLRMMEVYVVCIILGFVSELLRYVNSKRLKSANEHYEFVSMHDFLTNVANQTYLARYLNDIYEKRAEVSSFGCLFIDVDGFKLVNDKYGHLFGNTVLIKIAEILVEEKSAFVCRWGGDEFVVCFKNIDEDLLVRIGEKYRAAVSAVSFSEKPHFHITISVGAVVMPVDDSFNFNHVLELADSANRRAKNKGKDNVTLVD